MAQYREGTIHLTFGDPAVTGVGTRFLSNVRTGDMLLAGISGPAAFIATVLSDTELLLEQGWPGMDVVGADYAIHRDFDPTTGAPLLAPGDTGLPLVFNRAVGLLSVQTAAFVAGSEAVTAAQGARDEAQAAAGATAADAAAVTLARQAVVADKDAVTDVAAAVAADRQTVLTAREIATAGAATTTTDRAAVAADKAATATALAQAQALVGQAGTGTATGLVYGAISKQIFNDSTMVVHVYDTSRDSDGGAWTQRCRGTSWYNEPLNTATRGATRRFPKVALILAANRQVLIYDAHDLGPNGAPRLWMQFAGTGAVPVYDSAYEASTLHALNGRVYLGVRGTTWSGLINIDFPADRVTTRDAATLTHRNTDIAARNITGTGRVITSAASARLVSGTVHDVHAHVLPGAPLDAAGLPVPTLAVATAAGLSIIHPWGQVYDVADASGFQRVQFMGADRLMATLGANPSINDVGPVPYADYASNSAWRQGRYGGPSTGSVLKFPIEASVQSLTQGALGSNKGLRLLADDKDNPSAGMVAFATTGWATGWQPGDIRGGWLSDMATGNITGPGELVVNGAFTGGTTSWTAGANASLAVISTELEVTGSSSYNYAQQVIATVVGQTYVVTATLRKGTSDAARLSVYSGVDVGDRLVTVGTGTVRLTFQAQSSTTYVSLTTGSTSGTAYFSAISAKLGLPDRSHKANGLIVNGTLSRTALGSGGLAAISGFSASNYLEQPPNPDLDFGTGDFCVLAWLFHTAGGLIRTIADRAQLSSPYANPFISLETSAADFPRMFIRDDAGIQNSVTSAVALTAGTWSQVAWISRTNVLEMWVDGVRTASAPRTGTGSLSNEAALLRVGLGVDGARPYPGGIAMLRMAAYAPTPVQIRKMYTDERPLIVGGMPATLGGTSNYVRSVSANGEAGTLAVATDDGFSVFTGLARTASVNSSNSSGAIAEYPLRSISGAGSFTLAATLANAGFFSDPVIARDQLLPPAPLPALTDGLQVFEIGGVTSDATPTDLSPRFYVGEQESIVIEVTIHARGQGAGSSQGGLYKRLARYTRDVGGTVTLAGSVQVLGADQETSTGMDATLIADPVAQTVTPRVTGVAGTRMVWTARITIIRIAKEGTHAAA